MGKTASIGNICILTLLLILFLQGCPAPCEECTKDTATDDFVVPLKEFDTYEFADTKSYQIYFEESKVAKIAAAIDHLNADDYDMQVAIELDSERQKAGNLWCWYVAVQEYNRKTGEVSKKYVTLYPGDVDWKVEF